MNSADKASHLERRKQRVRQRVFGTDERPRLNVFRSRGHIYAQIINDLKGTTLVAASSLDKSLRSALKSTSSIAAAKAVGTLLAERAKGAKVQTVVFDRGGRLYHGRVKALADASREGGLKF
ncbi:50S ribosomal subunit protein L18 [Nitrospira sp. KM1]|uniref:50S ribosomal protein L18 n=1 Tax=Nitrospira sp. KM1 TaxID=1936990 RepID=UPI0013A711E7|nr:50S ribosomal protein L18 [Nitrospira sp. KM1]BCA56741.1 50S ribosomal subunit protein L18 [Nitrospira sp. KM1]